MTSTKIRSKKLPHHGVCTADRADAVMDSAILESTGKAERLGMGVVLNLKSLSGSFDGGKDLSIVHAPYGWFHGGTWYLSPFEWEGGLHKSLL